MPIEISKFISSKIKGQVTKFCFYFINEAIIEVKDHDGKLKVYLFRNNNLSLIPQLSQIGVKSFVYSQSVIDDNAIYHAISLTNDGRIFGWGKNNYKQVDLRKIY